MLRSILVAIAFSAAVFAQSAIPSGPLAMRDFRLEFTPAGTFTLGGDPGWPPMAGRWKIAGNEITLQNDPGPSKCDGAATYRLSVEGASVGLDLVADDCRARVMILDRSRWAPPGTAAAPPSRSIVRTAGTTTAPLRRVPPSAGDWPSFRGREAAASPRNRTWSIGGTRRPARTCCGRRRSRDWHIRARSCGAIRCSSRAQSAAAQARRSSPDSTATATHRTIDRSIDGCCTRSTSAPARFAGSGSPRKASLATSVTSNPPTPAPPPPPTAASSSPGSDRRASTPTT